MSGVTITGLDASTGRNRIDDTTAVAGGNVAIVGTGFPFTAGVRIKRWWFTIFLVALIGLRFAQPIEDGDLFWHMRYGAQMVDCGTLRTDHSLYSWMPASNVIVYCAWTGELLFLAIWKAFGLAGIFALRYVAVLAVSGLLLWHARRAGSVARAESWLAIVIALLASVVATLPKPEMLSLVLWNALVFCWFGALRAERRLPWIYAMPAIVLVWVNTHGAFVLAAPLLAIACIAGFVLFPRCDALHLAAATAVCALATAVNPYGLRYPLELAHFGLSGSNRADLAWNNAFQPAWGAAGMYLHLPEFLVWMTLFMAALVILSRARERWALAALFAVYAPLYLLYVRSSFLLPAIFAYSALLLTRDLVFPRLTPSLACALMLFFGTRSVYTAAVHPSPGSWLGFGISDLQPVAEAEYVASHRLGPRIYNTFNAGGYLLWRLWPADRVMVDARSFPYLEWFDELVRFSRTTDPREFQEFLDRHPADAAVVDFQEETWRSFLTVGWRPAFYGPAGVVFVPPAKSPAPLEAATSLKRLANGDTAARVFAFSVSAGDYATAWNVLEQMRGPLRPQVSKDALEFATTYRGAHEALAAHRYGAAWAGFDRAFAHRPFSGQDNDILLLLRALQRVDGTGSQAAVLRAGLDRLALGVAR